MAAAVEKEDSYVVVGPREYLDRLLAEYHLSEEELGDRIQVRAPARWMTGKARSEEYLLHESELRSHGEFACAGDEEALAFCEEITDAMVRGYGILRSEAVARVNRQWSHADPPDRVPRVWIVGANIVYHEDAENWATFIYYGPDSLRWDPQANLQPLPPP